MSSLHHDLPICRPYRTSHRRKNERRPPLDMDFIMWPFVFIKDFTCSRRFSRTVVVKDPQRVGCNERVAECGKRLVL